MARTLSLTILGAVFSVSVFGQARLSDSPAAGGLTVEPLDSSINGLALTLADDSSFTVLARQLIPAGKLAAVEPYLSQALILTNNSGQALRAVGFHFNTYTGSNRKPSRNSYLLAKDDFAPTVMAAGERVLLPLRYGQFSKTLSGGEPKHSTRSDASVAVSFSLDLVVYSDWRVAGPDISRQLVIRIADMRARSDVCGHIDSFTAPGAASLDWLKNAAAPQAQVAQPPTDESEYKRAMQHHAELLLSMLQPGDALGVVATGYCASAKSAFEATAALHR